MATNDADKTVDDKKQDKKPTMLQKWSSLDWLLMYAFPFVASGIMYGLAATGNFQAQRVWIIAGLTMLISGLLLSRSRDISTRRPDGIKAETALVTFPFFVIIASALLTLGLYFTYAQSFVNLNEISGRFIGDDLLGFFKDIRRGELLAQLAMIAKPIVAALMAGFGFSGLLHATRKYAPVFKLPTKPVRGKPRFYRDSVNYNVKRLRKRISDVLTAPFVSIPFWSVVTIVGVTILEGISMSAFMY